MLSFLPFSCTKTQDSEELSPTNLKPKSSDVLSNIISQMITSQRRNSFKTAAELESRALSLATNNLISDIEQYNKFKVNTGFNDLLGVIEHQSANKRQSFAKTPLSLLDTCSIFSSKLMNNKNSSNKVNQYVDQLSKAIGSVGDDYLKKLEKEAVVINNKKYLSNDKFKHGEYIEQVLDKVDKIQKDIDSDNKLNIKERKALETYVQTVQTNIVNIDIYFSEMFKLSIPNGRLASFWDAIASVFSSVIAAIITVVVTAVGTLVGFLIGEVCGAVAGFAIGASIGYAISCENILTASGPESCEDCASFLGSGCNECKTTYPWYTNFSCM